MECPNCSFENAGDARFCENCGQPLERACPNCGQAVPASARFCRHCGHDLTRTAAAPSTVPRSAGLEAIRRAAPSAMAKRILADRERTEGERKRVTALFADIVGSTSLAEALDPEDWREIVTGAHQRVSEEVYAYEGTIAQLLGDGVLAFFGAPLTHEDDPERAIRAGLAILESIRQYGRELVAAGRVPQFQMRLGLNSGLVVVGDIGSDLHMEYLAVGDTVNLAARIQSAADPDTLLVTENTHRLTGSLFDFEDRGRVAVKGKSGEIQVYRVLRERPGAARRRGVAGLDSPMVGRQREFTTLLHILDEVRHGRGATVAVVGEAGLGKSRLIAEWRRQALGAADGPPLRWVEGRCLSYGAAMAHHLSTEILRGLIGAPPEASPAEAAQALRDTLARALADSAGEVFPFLAHLLGLELDDENAARVKYLDGPALQARYISSYTRLIRALCAEGPLVIICEDLHWADPSSVELGRHVLPVVRELPLIVGLVLRPEKESSGWRLLEAARETAGALEIHLAPLGEDDTQDLVRHLLDIDSLPEDLRHVIRARAEGNPFFVEEVLRMLIDEGRLQRAGDGWRLTGDPASLEIPDTLQGVLASRIDRLPEEAKRTLQIAAVIGRTFQVRVLEEVIRRQTRGGAP
jgi:class 3 adenylate cyclase